MTTFQDPQPHSRRVARQSERSESAESTVGFTQFPTTEQPPSPQTYPASSAPVDMWDTTSRRSAHISSAPASPEQPAPGRRAAPAAPGTAAEPLTYTTQSRQPVPTYDGPTFAPTSVTQLPPTQAMPQAEQPAYRVRDISPEARRAAPSVEPVWQAPTSTPTDLDYHTQGRVEPQHSQAVDDLPEQTLSRREMRAMLQAEQDAALQATAQSVTAMQQAPLVPPLVEPMPVSQPGAAQLPPMLPGPVQDAFPQVSEPVAPATHAPEPVDTHEESVFPFALLQSTHAEPTPAGPTLPPIAQEAPVTPPPVDPRPDPTHGIDDLFSFGRAPEPHVNTGLTNAIAEFDSLTAQPEQPVEQTFAQPEPVQPELAQQTLSDPIQHSVQPPAPSTATPEVAGTGGVWTPPVGHWSTQADLDDESQVYENTLNRTIGTGSVTTSALVLPSVPLGSDIRGALTGTGEIMLTGSIDLPHSLGSSGTSDRFEHGGIDSLFDMNDADVVSTDSAPVRAIRAVSTHNTSGHGVTHTQKPKGTRALTALLIAASSMAVVVAGLLIAAFAFNVF